MGHSHTHSVAFSGPKDCLANLFKFDQGMAYGVRLIDPLMNSAFFIWKKHMFMDKGHQLGCTKIKEMYLTSLSQKKLHEGSPILRVWYVFKRTVEKNPPDGIHAFGEKLHVTIPKKGVKLLNFNVTYSLNNGGNETGLDFLLTWFLFRGDVMLALCRISSPANLWDFSPTCCGVIMVCGTNIITGTTPEESFKAKWVFNMAPAFIAHDHTKTLQCCLGGHHFWGWTGLEILNLISRMGLDC